MAKTSKPSIIDEIKALPAIRPTGRRAWLEQMKRTSPEQYEALNQVVDDFNRDGVSRQVFGSLSALYRYLAGKDPDRPRERLIDIGFQGFRGYVMSRQERRDG